LKTVEGDTLAFTSLQQKVAQLNANYQLYLQKRDAAQISEAMNQEGLINIGLAQSPTFSLTPVRPRPIIDSVLGVFTSLFLACFAVFLADSNRQTIASPAELQGISPYPLLATVALGDEVTELTPQPRHSFSNAIRRRG
jgi:capsular polysaccharide biosynthesis protein